jgi:endonuclease-3
VFASRPLAILSKLRETFVMPSWSKPNDDPFRTLIVTIISQNTADGNTAKAFEQLSKKFEISAAALANAETGEIEKSLKVAGLYRNKTRTIKRVSRMILDKYHGSLESILSLPLDEARRSLLELPGVGPKTADVVLLFCAGKPTIPVDTHVNRVSKRLGLVPENGDCEKVRQALQSLYSPKDYLAIHILLILHGRKYCRARIPLCECCPLNALCPSRHLWDKND